MCAVFCVYINVSRETFLTLHKFSIKCDHCHPKIYLDYMVSIIYFLNSFVGTRRAVSVPENKNSRYIIGHGTPCPTIWYQTIIYLLLVHHDVYETTKVYLRVATAT